MLLPALAKAKSKATGISCLSNSKQLMLAWISYSGDYDGNLVHNTHGGEAQSNNLRSRYSQWIMGWLDWGLRPDNTNVLHVTDPRYAKLAAYQGNSKNLVSCPADKYVSMTQKKKGWSKRIRTFSMNSNMGEGNGKLWYGSNFHQIYLKEGDIIDPSNKWVVVDEHPDSMNDGCFFTNMTTPNPSYVDLPGTMHNNACGYGFAGSGRRFAPETRTLGVEAFANETREHGIEKGIDPGFSILDEYSRIELCRAAAFETIREDLVGGNEGVRRLFGDLGLDRLIEAIPAAIYWMCIAPKPNAWRTVSRAPRQ